MSMNDFTQDDLMVLAMYEAASKDEAISKITGVLPYIDDPDMVTLVESVIGKLEKVTDAEYQALNISAYENLFDEEEENSVG